MLVVVVACGLALDLARGSSAPVRAGSTFALMQMNVCLSGLAGCYGRVAYPDIVPVRAILTTRD